MGIKIVLSGNCAVKKNSIKTATHRYKMVMGQKIPVPLKHAIAYPTGYYVEWFKRCKQELMTQKSRLQNEGYKFPLEGCYNVKFLFYMDKFIIVDLSALYEAPQDLLVGGKKDEYNWMYQILLDDNVRVIGSHDGSRFLLDKENPRTEIYITPYKLEKET